MIIIITLVLKPVSILDNANNASLFHSVLCLGFQVVNSTLFKVFLNAVQSSYRGCATFLVPSVFVNFICGEWIVSLYGFVMIVWYHDVKPAPWTLSVACF